MAEYEVTGVNVANRGKHDERITDLCGVGFPRMSVRDVISKMKAGDRFVVAVPGEPRVQIHPVHPTDGREPFVSTSPDGTADNNLLRLTSTCP